MNMQLLKCFLLNIVIFNLFACGTSSNLLTIKRDQCIPMTAKEYGILMGASGKEFQEGKKLCSISDQLNDDELRSGYQIGLQQYCTETQGLNHGLKGEQNFPPCSTTMDAPYVIGYLKGRKLYVGKQNNSLNSANMSTLGAMP